MQFLFSNQHQYTPIKAYPPTTNASYSDSEELSPLKGLINLQEGISHQLLKGVQKPKKKGYGKGKWTKLEQIAYINFIKENISEMQTKLMRKSRKVFLQMSKVIKTRTADQCRSHHQKILIYHQNLEEIIRFYTQGEGSFELQRRQRQVKKQAKTSLDEPSKCVYEKKEPFTMKCIRNHIRIIVQDCLIQPFNMC